MSNASEFKPRIVLNQQRGVAREDLPAHWDDAFIQDLARFNGWTRHYPFGECIGYDSEIEATLQNWSMCMDGLLNATAIIDQAGAPREELDLAHYGLRFAMRALLDDLQDIIELIRRTEGKWEEPAPSENLEPVEVAS